jgi:hypothetical protein
VKRREFIAGILVLVPTKLLAFDHKFDPKDPITQWFGTLQRPDMPPTGKNICCKWSDAYEVKILEDGGEHDDWRVEITDGSAKVFPDGTTRAPVENGMKIPVPASKVTKPKQGNPTSTAWLFMSINFGVPGNIFCLVPLPPGF